MSAEQIKASSDHLRGAIAGDLASEAPAFSADAAAVLKFHGVYQQDDRDVRRERGRQGLGKAYACMVRAAIPGGRVSGAQYLALDALADEVADGTLRITTRQALQYHFVAKSDLQPLLRTLNERLVTTLAACGDVVRNVMCCPAPSRDREHAGVQAAARELSDALKPRTSAYWQLWVDGERAVSAEPPPAATPARGGDAVEPLYGPTYLPRKFKIGFAFPGDNCVDAYTNDVGIVPHLDDEVLTGFTLLVGGGLGMSHGNEATYPRLGDPLGSVAPEDLVAAVTAIVSVQRDFGDRTDRKHARMKYLVAEWGVARFRAEVEARLGAVLDPPRALDWDATTDHLGWGEHADGRLFLGVRVPAGRIADAGGVRLRSALRAVVERHAEEVRFTPRQDVLLTGIDAGARGEVDALLAEHGVVAVHDLLPVARHALACPALPTCGLAIAEAERALPRVVSDLGDALTGAGVAEEAVHVRMTGCPNGCARPYSTEVGVVGRGKDRYTLFLGGDAAGTRLNAEFADLVGTDEIASTLRPVFDAFAAERSPGEAFGAWCDRVGVKQLAHRFAPSGDRA